MPEHRLDVLLGDIDGCPVCIDRRPDEAWRQPQFVVDVEPEGFSLAAGPDPHFVTRAAPTQCQLPPPF